MPTEPHRVALKYIVWVSCHFNYQLIMELYERNFVPGYCFKYRLCRKPRLMVSVTLCGNYEGDPLSPPGGRQHAGASLLVPPYMAILHGASPDEAASARGPIAHQYNFSYRISHENRN